MGILVVEELFILREGEGGNIRRGEIVDYLSCVSDGSLDELLCWCGAGKKTKVTKYKVPCLIALCYIIHMEEGIHGALTCVTIPATHCAHSSHQFHRADSGHHRVCTLPR
jgi:hypothetical protein